LVEIVMLRNWLFFVDWDRLLVWLRLERGLDMVMWLELVPVSPPSL
jgi:hypothetical protein